jgi:protein-L-isoaspartate(D-aspartate) O-methyltransferase
MPQEPSLEVSSPGSAQAVRAGAGIAELLDAIASAGIRDPRILEAFVRVPRDTFVPRWLASRSFEDVALPIGCGQTISQPSMVAIMLSELEVDASSRVLEVGAGSGYAACLLSHLAHSVQAVERHQQLAQGARNALSRLGRTNVTVYHGDGAACMPRGPFDRILISAAAAKVPDALLALLPPLGRLVAPIGDADTQLLMTYQRDASGQLSVHESVRCRFVPLVSHAVS